MTEKKTEYCCCKCGLRFPYEKLVKNVHFSVGKLDSYIHRCPNCNHDEFAIYSVVKH